MTVRPLRTADESSVRSLQSLLDYADPDIVDAALVGPFVGRVAIEDGEVVGYAIALPGEEATLSELAVTPESRREGYGRQLVDEIAEVTDADRLVVTTPKENEAAKAFYESLGFDVDERLSGFYADGSDALRLVRRK
ncbi:GNAT family N-acetyltransferase [Natronomonas halophila]|uniref:GNAT family N-acetyltransferase n=1 Tax=Natronomonas halophila TaxID=2747817 RepID=UPI0015B50CB5|nr:GNAT family N-acetyltransferase [Natronomonas halophila]QLD84755.1 GNAT family N-acetyltransferase [Natronomonas halophila]